MLARLAGDEFVFVHRGHENFRQRQLRADQMIGEVSSEPYSVVDKNVSIGVSAGHAAAGLEHQSAGALAIAADQTLYAAKADGKNCAKANMKESPGEDPADEIAA